MPDITCVTCGGPGYDGIDNNGTDCVICNECGMPDKDCYCNTIMKVAKAIIKKNKLTKETKEAYLEDVDTPDEIENYIDKKHLRIQSLTYYKMTDFVIDKIDEILKEIK